MRQDKVKQVIVISEKDAPSFEQRMNEALSGLADPDIKLYDNTPYVAVITYKVTRNVPEDILELFELAEGEEHLCSDCPHYVEPTDKRKRWGACSLTAQKARSDSRACEHYYLFRYKALNEASTAYRELPFTAE